MGRPYLRKRHGLSETLSRWFHHSRLLATITLWPQGTDPWGPRCTWTLVGTNLTQDPAPVTSCPASFPLRQTFLILSEPWPCTASKITDVFSAPWLSGQNLQNRGTKRPTQHCASLPQTLWGRGLSAGLSFHPFESRL